MTMPTTSLLQRLTAPMSRRTGLAALVGLAAGAFGRSETDAKKKKKKGPITVCARGCKYTTLQEAVDAAAPFGEICLKSGEYVEQVSITKSVTISPCKASDVVTIKAPTNDHPEETRLFTVILPAADDVFQLKGFASNRLTLGTLGNHSYGAIIAFGEGIQGSLGSLVLNKVVLSSGNAYNEGGGIWAKAAGATIRLTDTEIESCNAYDRGGGIVMNGGTLTIDGASQVSGCNARTGAGIVLDEGATLNLGGTTIIGGLIFEQDKNDAWADVEGIGQGGGIYARAGTTINMGSQAQIIGNKAYEYGGGIFAEQGVTLLNSASCANTANIKDNVVAISANPGHNIYQVNGITC